MEIGSRICLLAAVSWVAICLPPMLGQNPAFTVASIKPDTVPFRPPNFPLDASDAFRPVGGHFSADFPLGVYLTFAYKLPLKDGQHFPDWVYDRFDIQAEAEGNPTKDQMRLMMQALLAERFQLKVHVEMPMTPVLAMVLVKPDKTGPKLRLHSEGVPCEAAPVASTFPPVCDIYSMTVAPNAGALAGSRNTTMELLAHGLQGIGRLDRPVVDQTGLSGRFDFSIEFVPETGAPSVPDAGVPAEAPGSSFLEALRQQLGLRLEATKAPVQVIVVDRVERPSAN